METNNILSEEELESFNGTEIGDVVFSMLPPVYFEKIRKGYVLMDGRDVTGSKYNQLTKNTFIPDGRGMFFRSENAGKIKGSTSYPGYDQERAERLLEMQAANPNILDMAGSYQEDAVRAHHHIMDGRTEGGHGGRANTHNGWSGGTENQPHPTRDNVNPGFDGHPQNISVFVYICIN